MASNIISSAVAEPYAEALMSLAKSEGLEDQFGEQLKALLDLLKNSEELNAFLTNPLLKPEDKKAIIKKIAGEGANPLLVNFLYLLVDRRRIVFIAEIAQKYLGLLRKLKNTVLAEVTSASELSDDQKQAIADKVKNMTDAASVELSTTVDPSLIGGVIVKVGSQILDASLRGQLRRISLNLTSAG